MIVVMHDDFNRDLQRIVRTVLEISSTRSTAEGIHQHVGFVSGCKKPEWEGTWLIYCGY